MRTKTPSRILAAILLAGGLAISGCSGDPKEDDGQEAASPLERYTQAIWGNSEWNAEQEKADHIKRQELIAECMNGLGFEFTPEPWDEGMAATPAPDEEPEETGPRWGTVEFAERYGYGIVSWPGMADEPTAEPDPGGDEWVDPNQEYVESLSASEQAAYYDTLFGNWDGLGDELDEDGNPIAPKIDPSAMGCRDKASLEVDGEQPWGDPEFRDLLNEMDMIYANAEAGDEMATLNREWSSCMAGKGFAFKSRSEAQNHIYELANTELYGEDVDWETYQGPTREQKDAFQPQEIQQAVADFSCAEQVEWEDRLQQLYFAYEQKFIDANRAQLDALVAKYGKGSR